MSSLYLLLPFSDIIYLSIYQAQLLWKNSRRKWLHLIWAKANEKYCEGYWKQEVHSFNVLINHKEVLLSYNYNTNLRCEVYLKDGFIQRTIFILFIGDLSS